MPDIKSSLRSLDRIEPPDVRDDAATREPSSIDAEGHLGTQSPTKRAAAAVVALVLFGAVAVYAFQVIERAPVGGDTTSSAPVPTEVRGRWQALPEGPLSPRYGASAFWVDGRVAIIGGVDGAPCPPAADCGLRGSILRDGAAFVPSTGTWSSIARSPIPIADANGVVLGDTIYLWDRFPATTAFLSYNVNENHWTELSTPPQSDVAGCCLLAATDDAVIAYLDSQERGAFPDLLYEPETSEWRELPPDPLISSFDRSMVWTGEELLLLAVKVEDVSQTDKSSYWYRAATLDIASGRWRRLPDSDIAGYGPSWFWSAGRAVNPTIGRVGDNGEVVGSEPPYGGILDPTTGVWSDLPPGPKSPREYGGPGVGGSDHVVSWQGAILDVATGTWSNLPAPSVNADEGAAAVWAGDRLIVWGGYAWANRDPLNPSGTLLNSGWSWLPQTGS